MNLERYCEPATTFFSDTQLSLFLARQRLEGQCCSENTAEESHSNKMLFESPPTLNRR
jgi:hypothetical protein